MRRFLMGAILLFSFTTVGHAETVYKVWHHGSQDLLRDLRLVDGLAVTIPVTGPTQVFIWGHIDIKHRCLPVKGWGYHHKPSESGAEYPIAIGVRLEHLFPGQNFGPNHPGTWVRGSKWGPNLVSCSAHYIEVPLDGYVCLETPGSHRIAVWALAASDVNLYDGVAEINPASDSDLPGGTTDPYNEMIVRTVPIAKCPEEDRY